MKQILLLSTFILLSFGAFAQKAGSAVVSSEKVEIVIYPNPAVDFIALEHNNEEIKKLEIRNIVGAKLAEFEVRSEARYDLSGLARGLYLVQVLDEKDQLIATRRIKKQ